MTIQEFFNNPQLRNHWIEWKDDLRVYVRRQQIHLGGQRENARYAHVLALANMGCDTPGKGLYREFLAYLYHKLPIEFEGMYVENILSDRLYDFHLKQHGWKSYRSGISPDHHAIWYRKDV